MRKLKSCLVALLIVCMLAAALPVVAFAAETITYTSGDVNSDGSINNRDLALLMQYINGWEVLLDETTADFNKDGEINNKDYVLLMRKINGWENPGDYSDGIELPTDKWY